MLRSCVICLLLASFVQADIWIVSPAGYYVLSIDATGTPILTEAVGITAIHILGKPTDPIPPKTPPQPPTDDKWGLVAASEKAAKVVVGDPDRNQTALKIGATYVLIGQQVQAGKISQDNLKTALTLGFGAASGSASKQWTSWRNTTRQAYNSKTFANAEEAGQGIIDLGIGATRSSDAAIGDGEFLKFFIEVLLPLIMKLIELFAPTG